MITVIGSINMDLVIQSDRLPVPGETILGESFQTNPGGKGANQAIAASKLGYPVQMVGKVGNDTFGDALLENLNASGVSIKRVKKSDDTASGIASITVVNNDNSIIVVPGANFEWEDTEAESLRTVIRESDMIIVQLETPLAFVEAVVSIAYQEGIPSIVNPAPAQALTTKFMEEATYLTPNETECENLFHASVEEAVGKYPNKLIVTEGKKGAAYHNGEQLVRVDGFPSEAIDTTGAGDTFNGALGVALSEGMPLDKAVCFANAAASLSVEKFGAQGGMPTREMVEYRLEQHGRNDCL